MKRNQRGLAGWVKVLLAVVIVGFIVCAIAVVGIGSLFMNTAKSMMDPSKIKEVASQIATFPEPLPGDFKYIMGIDVMGVKTVSMQSAQTGQSLTFMTVPQDKAARTPDETI